MTASRWLPTALLLVSVIAPTSPALAHNPTVILGATIIDGTGAPPKKDHVLVIDERTVLAVIPEGEYRFGPGTTLIEAYGQTVLPGIVNAHTHFTHEFAERRDNHLLHGVTSICNLAAGAGQMSLFDVYWNEQGEYAARGFKTGPMIAKAGGYPEANWGEGSGYNVDGPDEAAAAVRELAERGADLVKISLEPGPGSWPILSPDELRAVVDTAHGLGLGVVAHVEDAGYLTPALDGGVDAVTHVPTRIETGSGRQSPFAGTPDAPELTADYDRALARMAEAGVRWVPTLDVLTGDEEGTLRSEGMLEAVRRFHARGGVIALGNDYPLGVTEPGIPFGEMELLLAAGLDPMDVIVASTRHAAEVCGHGDDLGTLEPGKLADLIVVDGDPLEDIHALERLRLVILDGRIVFESRAVDR